MTIQQLQFLQEIEKNAVPQNDTVLKFEGEPPKRYRVINDEGLWFVEELSTGRKHTLYFNDRFEFYCQCEAHDGKGNFLNTTSGYVSDITHKHITLKYSGGYSFLMSSGTEVYNYYPQFINQPIQSEKEVEAQSESSYIGITIITLFIVLAIISTLALAGWI